MRVKAVANRRLEIVGVRVDGSGGEASGKTCARKVEECEMHRENHIC